MSVSANANEALLTSSVRGALAWRVTLFFALLLLLLEAGLYGYWRLLLRPRLVDEAQAQATVLAQSNSALLSEALSAPPEQIRARVQAALDQVLLLKSPSGAAIFKGVQLDLDFDSLQIQPVTLAGIGDESANGGQSIDVALYSSDGVELFGIAKISVNTAFFDRLSLDVRRQMLLQSLFLALALTLLWLALSVLIARHERQRQRFADALTQARDQALAASRSKSQFLANMSHEIRTPMNAVLGMASLLRKSPLDARQRAMTGQLMDSAKLLLGVLNDILDLSRIEAGKLAMQSVDFLLRDCLQSLSAIVRERALEKQLALKFEVQPDVPEALIGDPMRLQQVLVNLASNAIKFTEIGSITVRISVQERYSDRCNLRIEVIDTGVGIAPAALAKLFEAFSQVDESDTRRHGGSGLGLAICKRLVELMGGTVQCTSTPGQGSNFFFNAWLCCLDPHIARTPVPKQGLRALVVDDHPNTRDTLGSMLEDLRFDVSLSDSAENALIRLSLEHFDVLLIDWRLPGMGGIEAVRELYRHRLVGALPMPHSDAPRGRGESRLGIIVMSAFNNPSMHREALSAGAHQCLTKPIDKEALFAAVMQSLHASSEHMPALGELDFPAPAYTSAVDTSAVDSVTLSGSILVVEDHPVNREVAQAILSSLGLTVQTAASGKLAIALLRAQPHAFDVVLMDVQMPELDGVETTEIIKADPALRNLPVVALTAHAMSGDRERFLAAGMDDYLCKPLDELELIRVLTPYLKQRAAESAILRAAELEPAPEPAPAQLENLTEAQQSWQAGGVDVAAVLRRLNGKTQLIATLLHDFCLQHQHIGAQLQSMLEIGHYRQAAELVHTLRGAAGALSVKVLMQHSATLEQAFRAQTDDAPTRHALSTEMARLCAALRISVPISSDAPNLSESDAGTSTIALPAEFYAKLHATLSRNDLAADTLLSDYLDSAPVELRAALAKVLAPTQQKIAALDYDAALVLLQGMAITPSAPQ